MYSMKIKDLELAQIEESGQCFRFRKIDCPLINPLEYRDSTYQVISGNRYLEISSVGPCIKGEANEFLFSCSKEEFDGYWRTYFDLDTDYGQVKSLVDSKDSFMSNAIEYGWGIRILRQDLWEMIISFIISQRKSIPAIRSSIESLCQAYGEDIVVGDVNFKAFPKAEALSRLSLDDLKAHGVGYRDKYILAAANDVVAGRLDLDKLSNMDEEEARAALLDLFGVGIKVANCVLLFALHHVDSFPIDVWIQRVIDQEYGGQFPIEQYSGFAGIVQQYMFYYGRGR